MIKKFYLEENKSIVYSCKLTEEDYQKYQADKKEENSPFAGLQGLFDE